jgi:hypothetical protein
VLTAWGYSAITSDPSIAGGSVMHTLLMRAFPLMYEFNSVYAMFPFTVPSKTREVLTKSGTLSSYSFELPKQRLPSIAPPMKSVSSYDACRQILSDPDNWKVIWGPTIKSLTGGVYMLSGDTPENTNQHKRLAKEVYGPTGAFRAIEDFFENITSKLVEEHSFKLDGYFEMDAVREYSHFIAILMVVWQTWRFQISFRSCLIFPSKLPPRLTD